MTRDLRRRVFQKVEGFSSTEFDQFSTASLITRTTNDVTQLQMVVIMMMRMVIYAPIMGVGGIIRAINKDSSMWWTIAVGVAMLISLMVVVFSLSLPKFKIMQKLIDRLNLVTRENLSGMMVIRAFNMQPFEESAFDKANQDLTSVSLFVNRVMVGHVPADDVDHERPVAADHLGRGAPGGAGAHAGGRYDGVHAVRHADRVLVPDDVVHVHHHAARVGIGEPDRRGAGDRIEIRDPEAAKKFCRAIPRHGRVPQRVVPLPRRRRRRAARYQLHGPARPDDGLYRLDRLGQVDGHQPDPALLRCHRGQILIDGVDVRAVTQHDLREKIGYIPQKRQPVLGHDREQPALCRRECQPEP
jgi:ATP-binding cassette, subfamily B, multidrug efflux pump